MSRAVALALAAFAAAASPAAADDAAEFMTRFSGKWQGTGRLLIGAESGLTFNCSLAGDPSRTLMTFGMAGRCWMGGLSAPVHAQLRYNAETGRFYGSFLDGADGDGLDIVASRAGAGFSMQLVRGPIQGRLMAEAVERDRLEVTVYYRDRARDREVPVIAMDFARADLVTGSVARTD